ncbi:MAG: shikimate dehydrogenase [Eubacterium sp.]|nr:shikimate dehydrogenase [Eubacterium sp.]
MRSIDGKTKLLGVIGNPIEHTLSPVIHNTLCDLKGIKAVYVPIHVESDIAAAVKGFYAAGAAGLNVTVPYKQSVMESVVDIDDLAKRIGAVNTLVPAEGGYKGYNTDMPGLARALNSKGVELAGKKAVVIGAGGAARAVCVMLEESGVEEIYLLNRSVDKAEAIASELTKVKALSLTDHAKIPEGKYVMFQCTSLGLKESDSLAIDDDSFYEKAEYGYDLIYNPAETPFIKKLNSLGIPNDNGLTMLLYQGIIAFEYWFDVNVTQDEADIVLSELCRTLYGSNIILTGYMGSGKTTVGKALAEKYGMTFIDTDQLIEEKAGKAISKIFEESGEEAFRDMETELLKELLRKSISKSVISTGGGIVKRKENCELLRRIGRVFYLEADSDTLYERVKNDDTRPLLKDAGDELKDRIDTMLSKREGYYKLSAEHIIDTKGKTLKEIAEEVYINL